MFLPLLCLFAATALASAEDAVLDTSDAIRVKAFLPGQPENHGDTLRIRCRFDRTESNFKSLSNFELFLSDIKDGVNFKPFGFIDNHRVTLGLSHTEIELVGRFYRVATELTSKLEITWEDKNRGYCTIYKCVATGTDYDDNEVKIYKTREVDAADGGSC